MSHLLRKERPSISRLKRMRKGILLALNVEQAFSFPLMPNESYAAIAGCPLK